MSQNMLSVNNQNVSSVQYTMSGGNLYKKPRGTTWIESTQIRWFSG
jgi:hypothetical protein